MCPPFFFFFLFLYSLNRGVARVKIMKGYFHRSRKFQHFIDLAITGAAAAASFFFFNTTQTTMHGYWPNKFYELLTVTKGNNGS